MTAIGCRSMSVTVACASTRGTVPTGPSAILALSRKRHGFVSRSSLTPRLSIYRPTAQRISTPCTAAQSMTKPWPSRSIFFFPVKIIRRRPLIERKNALKWVLRKSRGGIQYVEHTEGDGEKMFKAVCKLGLEGIVSKKLTSRLSVRAIEGLAENQKSKITGSDAGVRWDVLAREIARCGIGRRHIRAYSLASLNRGLFCAGFYRVEAAPSPRKSAAPISLRPHGPRRSGPPFLQGIVTLLVRLAVIAPARHVSASAVPAAGRRVVYPCN